MNVSLALRYCLCFLFIPILILVKTDTAYSFHTEVDSLEKLLPYLDDKGKIKVKLELSEIFERISLDSAFKHAYSAKNLSEKIKDSSGLSLAFTQLGWLNNISGETESAFYYLDIAKTISKNTGNLYAEGKALYRLGVIYMLIGSFDRAYENYDSSRLLYQKSGKKDDILIIYREIGSFFYNRMDDLNNSAHYLQEGLIISTQIHNYKEMGKLYQHIGKVYRMAHDTINSFHYYLKSESLLGYHTDTLSDIDAYRYIASHFMEDHNYDSALIINFKTLELCNSTRELKMKGDISTMIAFCFEEKQMYDSSIKYNDMALVTRLQIGVQRDIAHSYINIARNYIKTSEYRNALNYLTLGLTIGRKTKNKIVEKKALELLSRCYERMNLPDSALYFYKLFVAKKDSILNYETSNKVSLINMRHRKKEAVMITKEKEAERNLFIFISVFSFAFLILTVYAYNHKRKLNKILISNNEVIKGQNEQINNQNSELKELNKQLKNEIVNKHKIFSIIAHDLSNPLYWLSNISGGLVNKTRSLKPGLLEANIRSIHNTSLVIYHLSENLLLWGKSQAKMINMKKVDVNFRALLNDIADQFRFIAEDKNITIINEVKYDFFYKADRNMLASVIRNIISNAIKFTPENGEITLTLITNEKDIIISVADTGIGMDTDELDKIISFGQLARNDTQGNVTGLGLIICKEFVEWHNGQIEIETGKNKGTKFNIKLPIHV